MNDIRCKECDVLLDLCEVEEALRDGKDLCTICRVSRYGGMFSDDDEDLLEYSDELTVEFTPDDDDDYFLD